MASENIFQQYLQPVRSVQDYSNDMDRQEQNALTLAAGRMKAKADQQAMADDQAYREAAMQSGGDQNALVKALMGRGLVKQAQTVQTGMLETDAKRATTAKTKVEIDEKTFDLAKKAHSIYQNTLGALAYDPELSKEKAIAAGKQLVDAGILKPDMYQSSIQNMPDDPVQLKQTLLRGVHAQLTPDQLITTFAPKPTEVTTGQQKFFVDNNPNSKTFGQRVGAEPVQMVATPGEVMTDQRAREEGAANRGVTMRGQSMTDARMRESNGKAPPGYIWGPAGADGVPTLIAAKGGPADLKMVGALNQDTQALTGSVNSMDRLASVANEVLNHPGLKGISGMRGALPNMPGSDAADAQALLGTLKSQVGFGVLQDMRNNSKTGGALGSVSDAEGKRLEANLAALDKSQSLDQFKSNLAKIIKYSDEAKGRLREAYNLKHGYSSVQPSQAQGGAAAALPATNQQGWALHTDAKGNQAYVSPDGKQFQEVK